MKALQTASLLFLDDCTYIVSIGTVSKTLEAFGIGIQGLSPAKLLTFSQSQQEADKVCQSCLSVVMRLAPFFSKAPHWASRDLDSIHIDTYIIPIQNIVSGRDLTKRGPS